MEIFPESGKQTPLNTIESSLNRFDSEKIGGNEKTAFKNFASLILRVLFAYPVYSKILFPVKFYLI